MKTRKETMIQIVLAMALLVASQTAALAKKPVRAVPPAKDPTPTEPALSGKIRAEVAESGLYRVTATEIAATLGVTTSEAVTAINDGNVRVSSMGSEIAWLSANDSVYFYGEEIGGMYGGNNVYWIELGVRGTQMSTIKARAPRTTAVGGVFTDTQLFEEDHAAVPHLFYGEDDEFWFWDFLFNPYGNMEKTISFGISGVAAVSGTAQLRVGLQGAYDSAAAIDNHVRAYINGVLVGEAQWAGKTAAVLSATFSQSLLNTGSNELRIVSLLPTGAPLSLTYIDSFDISYLRSYNAEANKLKMLGGENNVVTVEGFSTADITVLDLSNPTTPGIHGGTAIVSTKSGYTVSLQPASSTVPYLAVSLTSAHTPASLTAHSDTGLADNANAASYVVIAPAALASAAAELADYRRLQGLTTKVVTLESIYDEFNDGLRDPLAIQAFLAHALAQWNEAPRYVVLAGQGSYDYNNVLGNGDCLVPSMMVYTPNGLVVSDSRYADTDNDGAPNLAIGRLPVSTAEELTAMVAKIRNYEIGGAWKDTVQMIADNDDSGGNFTSDAELAADLVPADRIVQKAYLSQQALTDVRAALQDSFLAGRGIVNYIGHGLMDKLADEGVLTQNDVQGLATLTAPVLLAMACDVGRYGTPGYDAVSEKLVNKTDGGAVAVWAAAGLAYSGESRILNTSFFEAMGTGSNVRLGDAVSSALTNYRDVGHMAFMRYVFNLMGDPATVLSNSTSL